jgi:hypothetical protein
MSVESKLKTALAATNLPVALDTYAGTASTYIVIEAWTNPIWHADDQPEYEQVMIRVHLYAPLTQNLTALKKQIKGLLFAAGYSYPSVIPLSDPEYGRQIVFDTECRELVT